MYQLPKWVLVNPLPAIYDFESMTAIEQTARIYGAMQKLIDEYNAFAEEANKQLATFTDEETEARKEFELNITKVMHRFRCDMEQYLKVNLDDTATRLILKGFNDGSVKIPTDNSLSHVNQPADAAATGKAIAAERARINVLAANNGSSTEGNAELIDIRAGFDGTEYETAGEAVRGQAMSINKNVEHLSNFAGHDGDLFPHNKNKWALGNYAIPDHTRRFRSDFVKVNPGKRKIHMKNPTGDIRLYMELYTIDDSGEYVYLKDTGSWREDYSFNAEGAAAIRVVIHRYDNEPVKAEDFYRASENIRLFQDAEREQKKIRVMQYNVGEFNMGRDISKPVVDQSKMTEYIAAYRKFFGEQMADILCLEECYTYMDTAENYPVNETLIDGIYPYKTDRSYGAMMASRHDVLKNEHKHFNNANNNNETGCLLHTMVADIYGREVFVCSGAFRVLATEESRKVAFDQLITEAAKYDYAIFGVDTNVLSADEHRSFTETAEANGFSVANGGYFGNIATLPGKMYQNIDNIFVKGGIVANAYAPDVFDTLTSDHLPIIADIILY